MFRKTTYTGPLTNVFSVAPLSYKIGVIRTLVDRAFKINNTWRGFHTDTQQLSCILMKNCFPGNIAQRVVINTFTRSTTPQLMYPGRNILRERPKGFSNYLILAPFPFKAKRKIKIIAKKYCKGLDIPTGDRVLHTEHVT